MTGDIFDRERLAGYNVDVLRNACVTHVGCGAGDNNAAQCLSLAGVGEQRFIDFDFVEASNLTRAPLFAHLRHRTGGKRFNKAKELALAALELSYAESPTVRYAPVRWEALGLGGFRGSHVVIAGVDSAGVRAELATATRLLGIPMVEAGFSGLRGNVSAYANAHPDEPCYACLNPNATPERISCQTYAANVAAEGRVPATQTMAAVTGALVAETVIRLLHGDTRLSGRVLTLDATSWRTSLMRLARDPDCRRAHRRIDTVISLPVQGGDAASRIFEALPYLKEPQIILPHAYVAAMPCAHCGARLRVSKPEWAVVDAPRCSECPAPGSVQAAMIEMHTSVTPDSTLARLSCRKLGLPPLSIVEVFDRASGASSWVELAGSLDELLITRRRVETCRAERNPVDRAGMNQIESDDEFRVLDTQMEHTP